MTTGFGGARYRLTSSGKKLNGITSAPNIWGDVHKCIGFLDDLLYTYRSQRGIGMYPFTINLVLQIVRFDIGPQGLDNPGSALFFNAKYVTCKNFHSMSTRADACRSPT